jgi:hypothetical protein
MLTQLLSWIGVGDEILVRLDQAVLAFQRPGILWVGIAVLVPVGLFVVRRQRSNLATASPGLRAALNLTRVAILTLLVLVLAGPYLRIDYEIDKRPVVDLLFDASQSMRLPAGPFESANERDRLARILIPATGANGAAEQTPLDAMTRAGLVEAVVNASRERFGEPLTRRFDVRAYAFGREPLPVLVGSTALSLPELAEHDAGATHLGDALGRALDDAAGRPVAGIFVFSDGQNTGGRSPAEVAQVAARAGTPLFTVPAGSAARPKDVAVVDVFTSGLVAKGDTARVSVTVESQGFEARPVKVELRDGEILLDSRSLTLHDAEQQKIDLTFLAKEPEAKYLLVSIAPLPEEPQHLHGNNTDIAFVRVSDEKLRVLFADGLPRWDFRFVKNAIRRDQGLGGISRKSPTSCSRRRS